MGRITFDTEYIDQIVAENDNLILKRKAISERLEEMARS